MMRHVWIRSTVMFLAIVTAVACGDDNNSSGSPTTPTPAPAPILNYRNQWQLGDPMGPYTVPGALPRRT